MNRKTYLFIWLCLFHFTGCLKNKAKISSNTDMIQSYVSQEEWKYKKINIHVIKDLGQSNESKRNIEFSNNYTLVYHFKGDCSTCIAEILEWSKKSNELKARDNISILYINNSIDNYLLEHYSNVSGISFDEKIILDKDSIFFKANGIDFRNWNYTNLLLLNTKNEVVAYGNPFNYGNVRSIYQDFGLID